MGRFARDPVADVAAGTDDISNEDANERSNELSDATIKALTSIPVEKNERSNMAEVLESRLLVFLAMCRVDTAYHEYQLPCDCFSQCNLLAHLVVKILS